MPPDRPTTDFLLGQRRRLEAERDELSARAADLEAEAADEAQEHDDLQLEGGAAQNGAPPEDREWRQGLARRERERLADVRRALEAIDTGTYGSCARCRAPIGAERLEARPETPYCVACEAVIERTGPGSRPT